MNTFCNSDEISFENIKVNGRIHDAVAGINGIIFSKSYPTGKIGIRWDNGMVGFYDIEHTNDFILMGGNNNE